MCYPEGRRAKSSAVPLAGPLRGRNKREISDKGLPMKTLDIYGSVQLYSHGINPLRKPRCKTWNPIKVYQNIQL